MVCFGLSDHHVQFSGHQGDPRICLVLWAVHQHLTPPILMVCWSVSGSTPSNVVYARARPPPGGRLQLGIQTCRQAVD